MMSRYGRLAISLVAHCGYCFLVFHYLGHDCVSCAIENFTVFDHILLRLPITIQHSVKLRDDVPGDKVPALRVCRESDGLARIHNGRV